MSSPFDHHIDITPPITPLKSRRNCKKDLTPINIGLAQNHFKDAWSLTFRLPSLSPPPSSSSAIGELVSSFDSLDTPPLSAASSSLSTAGLGSVGGGGGGGLTTPLDAVHPLFRLMSLGDDAPVDPFSVGSGGDRGKMMLDGSFTYEGPDDEDVFTSGPTRGLLFDPPTSSATSSSLNIVPPTPLLSSSAFSPPANAFSLVLDTAQYSYASSTDSMSFFSTSTSVSPPPSSSSPKTPTKAPSTASTSPSRTPKAQQAKENNKKKHRSRRSGKARALGLAGSNGSGGSTMDGSSSRTTTPKKGKGRAEAVPGSPFAETDHRALPVPLGSRPRAALQPAPELFPSGLKTVTLSKPESPMSSPVRSVQQRRRVPLGLSSTMNIENKGATSCTGRISSSGTSTSSQNYRQNVASPSSLTCTCFIPHQYRCAFFSWTPARSPAPSAVSQAASILLRSASEENMCQHGSSQVDIGDLSFCSYEQRVKTMQAAVHALSSHFDHLIAQTNQERNRYCPVYQLPIEILSFILVLACKNPPKPTMTDVARFRRVSKYFRDAIAATAAFWTDIRIGHPLAQEALVRSRGLLIDINTRKNQGIRLSTFLGGRDPLVEGVAVNSSRWRSLCFVGHPTPVEMGLLRCRAPQLRELYLDFQYSLYGTPPLEQPIIDPGEGQPLRHLCLNSVRLPWSTRLRQLKTLQLYSIEEPPNREELYKMLRSSTQLEQLVLSALGWNPAQEQPLDAGSAEPIAFPHLVEITLFDLQAQLTDFLCSVVRAPNTQSLVVGSAPIGMLSLQDTKWAPFHDTVAGCMDSLTCIDIDLDPIRGAISISTVPRPMILPPPSPKWKQSEVTQSFEMDCVGDNVLLEFPILAEFLAEKGDDIEFRLNVFPTDWDPSDDEVDAVVRGLTTLTGLVDLDIQYFQGGAQVVRHLSVEYENDLGAPAWVCPWLTKLNVKDVPNINQSDWHALLETRGPRRTLRPSGAGYPVRIMELQENMERP